MSKKATRDEYIERRLGVTIISILLTMLIILGWSQSTVLALNGDSEVILHVGDKYIELGATAFDNETGNLTNEIITAGSVDTDKPGIYFITYKVIGSRGNKRQIQREIIVEDWVEVPNEDNENMIGNTENTLLENNEIIIGEEKDTNLLNEGNEGNEVLENATPEEVYDDEQKEEATFISAKVTSYNKSLQGGNNNKLIFTVTVVMSDNTVYNVNHEENVKGDQKGSKTFNYDMYKVYVAWNDNNTVTTCEIR